MMATLRRPITVTATEANDDVDLARLDDDGGARQQATVTTRPGVQGARFQTPMIPGAREPGKLTTFGVAPLAIAGSLGFMDATTIAAHQRAGGGAPNQRRPARSGSRWTRFRQSLLRVFFGGDRS